MMEDAKGQGPTEVKSRYFKLKEGKITDRPKTCPKCGGGVYLAMHDDRLNCGSCGYTKWISKEDKEEDQ